MNKENKIAKKLDFLNANYAFEKQEIIEQGTYYTNYRPKTDTDVDRYKCLYVQYWRNFVILFEDDASFGDEFLIIDRNYFDTTKAHSLKERCYRFLSELKEDNSSRPENGDLLSEKNTWCILSEKLIKEIKGYYNAIITSVNEDESHYNLVDKGVIFRRITSNLFALLSAVNNLWEAFQAITIVKNTRFLLPESPKNIFTDILTIGLTEHDKYLVDTKLENLPKFKQEVISSDGDESSYRHFYPEDVQVEKERRHKEAEEAKRIEQELLEAEAREFGNFGVYAAMVAEGELHPDDPRYPF
ncbi:MAG: hypothetical protein NHB32_15130 [Fischerella sp. CENA71]|nr:hypothetical protein [Fischerella sp. CENA71]